MAPPWARHHLPAMGRAHVLVLEHHQDLREALVEALLFDGHVVTPARTAAAALSTLAGASDAQIPDAVVLDAQDGRPVLAELRAQPRYAQVAVITLSFAFDPPTDADADVRRPFRLEAFLGAVRDALRRRGFDPEAGRSAPPHQQS